VKKKERAKFSGVEWEHEFRKFGKSFWSRPSYDHTIPCFGDVSTAASITGFQRARLWEAICACEGFLYCDTDSIIAEKIGEKVKIGHHLGDWEVKCTGEEIAIAGKKLYAARMSEKFWVKGKNGKIKKWLTASKGVRFTENEILKVAQGEAVKHRQDAPSFSVKKGQTVVERVIMREDVKLAELEKSAKRNERSKKVAKRKK